MPSTHKKSIYRFAPCRWTAVGAALLLTAVFLPGLCCVAEGADGVEQTVRLVPPQARGAVSWATALSSDGRFSLTGGSDGIVVLWEMATGREIRRFAGHTGTVEVVAFGPEGKTAWSGGRDGAIRHWDLATGRELRQFVGHAGWVTTLDISPDGARLISGGNDATVRLWDATSGVLLWTLEAQGFVSAVRFSPNGRTLLTAGGMQRLNLWDVESGSQIREFPRHASGVNTCAFSPDGKLVLSGEGYYAAQNGVSAHPASEPADCAVRVYETATGSEVETLAGQQAAVLSARFSADGKSILGASDDGSLRVWETQGGKLDRSLTVRAGASPLHHLAFAVSQRSQGTDDALVVSGDRDTATLWNLRTGRDERTLQGETLPWPGLAVSPDGRLAASVGAGDIRLWDVLQGRIVRRFTVPRSLRDDRAAFSPDGKLLATCGSDRTLRLWDVETGRLTRSLSGHTDRVMSVAFRPDGQEVASGSHDGTVRLWRVGDGSPVRTLASGEEGDKNDLFGGPASWVTSVAYNPEGSALLAGYALVNGQKRETEPAVARLFETASGKMTAQYAAGTGGVWAVAFGKSGSAYTSSGDETVRRWNGQGLVSAQFKVPSALATLTATARDNILPIALAPSNDARDRVAIGGTDGIVFVWNPDSQDGARPLPGAAQGSGVKDIAWVGGAGGRRVISAGGDDTQRIWDASDVGPKGLLLTLLLLTYNDWMTIAPDGRFDASSGAVGKVHFARGLETFGAEQFFEQFYTPNLARFVQIGATTTTLAGDVPPAPPVAGTAEASLSQGMPPLVRIASPTPGVAADAEQASVLVEATEQNGGGIDRVRIYVNGRLAGGEPTTTARGIIVEAVAAPVATAAAGSPAYTKPFTVTLSPGVNVLRAVAFSRTGLESKPYEITITYTPKEPPRPVLHVLAVGVNVYRDTTMNLQYARPDAESLAALLSDRQKTRLFSAVDCACLTDAAATGEAVRAAFDHLAQTALPTDVVVLYLAGHGETVPAGDAVPPGTPASLGSPTPLFYFLPSDARQMAMAERVRQFGISGNEITGRLAKIKAGKLVLIYDACKSGAALAGGGFRGSDAEQQALVVLSRSLGVHILTASTSTQYAGEVAALGHGILTYAVLEGLNGTGNLSPTDPITVRGLLNYVEERVPVLTRQYRSGEQWPVLSSNGQNFPLTLVK